MDNQQKSQDKSSRLSSVLTTFRKLWLLIWKNMLLRRRHYIVTTLEVLLPTLCASIIAYSNKELVFGGENLGQTSFEVGGRPKGTKVVQVKEKIYDPIPVELVILKLQETLLCPGFGCPFAPSNEHTRKVILEFQDILSYHGVRIRFLGVPNEQAIEDLVLQSSFSTHKRFFAAAIVFESGFPVTGNKNDRLVSYKIRLKYEYSTYKGSSVASDHIMPVDDTKNLFPDVTLDPESHSGEVQKMSYIESGFLGIQLALDRALVNIWTGNDMAKHYNITVQPFPIPNHYRREQGLSVAYLFHTVVLPTFLVLGFIFIVPSIMRGVVGEKECGIRELLKMNGLPGWLQWVGWLINSMMILILSDTIVIILLFMGTVRFGDPGVWYLILFLYMMAATSFCFFLSTFFIRPTLAITVGIIFWLVSYFPIFIIFELYPGSITLSQSLWASLFPNIAFYLAAKIMMTYERDGIGAQWNNVATPVNPGHRLTLGHIIMMFILSTLLYFLLTAYLDNVIVTDYGVRKPWYYPFMPSTWNFKVANIFKKWKVGPEVNTRSLDLEEDEQSLSPGFEAEPSSGDIGIELINLRKVYEGNKVAVDNVNLKMYHGEIFVLLGHNGAGKTTTISMLSGICAPSGGTAMISGYSISGQMEKVRQKLGLCPQYNMLFERLTVYEHMLFFGLLKGITGKDSSAQLEEIMKKLQLWDKKDTISKNLSGGQKRKLHLGIALIGDSQVAILDEPTSGMDPQSRRAIWDVLLEIRGQRTTLLTTHFMEEADVLGDRIAIMASGKIQCCGTPSFLKKFYGAGYTLKLILSTGHSTTASLNSLSKNVSSDDPPSGSNINAHKSSLSINSSQVNLSASEILTLVQKHVPNAFLKEARSAHATRAEVFIILPKDTATNDVLTQLFASLNAQKQKMGIKTMGMSHTTVDEVFLRVGELAEETEVQDDESIDITNSQATSYHRHPTLSVPLLLLCQFNGLLIKKIIYTFRKRKLIIGQVVIPVLLLICAIICCNGFFAPLGHPKPRLISLEDYNNPIIPIFSDGSTQSDTISLLKAIIGRPAQLITLTDNSTVVQTLLNVGNKRFEHYRDHYIAGAHLWADVNRNTSYGFNILYSTVPNHAAPLAVNIASNLFLKKLGPSGNSFRIQVTNQPLRTDIKLIVGSSKPEVEDIFYATVLFEVFMPIGLALLAATFIVLPIEEKLCKAKQLQMMTGVHPVLYWGSSYIWDLFIVILVVLAMICCFPIFQSHEMYTSYRGVWVAFLILITYGFCSIPFSYLMSHFANSVSGGFAFVTIIHIISGLVIGIVVSALDMLVVFKPKSSVRSILQSIGRLFPTYGAVISTTRYVETAIDNGRCNVLTKEAKKLICENPWTVINVPSEWEYLECCDGCQKVIDDLYAKGDSNLVRSLYGISPECFLPKPYVLWQCPRESLQGTTIYVPGIAQELFFMLIMGIVYIILLFVMEYGYLIRELIEKLENVLWKKGLLPQAVKLQSEDEQIDEDVTEESERIKDIITEGNLEEDALIVGNLSKRFGKFAAVKQLSFGVHHGECFGLLGVNGAGKTTTFRMLTGDEKPTSGVEYAFGKCLSRNRKQYLSNIGYCPQFDGIIGVLTGREMLQLFSKLRGMPGELSSKEADRWLKKLGLFKSAKVQSRKYSGGMKRRLCAAIAMIGEPSIILLDEPTSGVDPVSRHQFWKVLQSLRNSGQAIILTSHSMEECEALCSRLGIMVNGELQCLGGVQHLKTKFAQGYTLALKLKSNVSVDSAEFSSLHEEIIKSFEPCIVKDKHNNFIQYECLNIDLSWEFLFKRMEELKKSNDELIEDYSLNETTLEEVFLSFARKQYGGRVVDHLYCSYCC